MSQRPSGLIAKQTQTELLDHTIQTGVQQRPEQNLYTTDLLTIQSVSSPLVYVRTCSILNNIKVLLDQK